MRKKVTPVTVVLILIAVVVFAGVISWVIGSRTPSKTHMDTKEYFGITSEDQVAVTTDSGICEASGKMFDGTPYIPYDTVISDINKRFYYDDEEQKICVTTPTVFISEDLTDSATAADARTEDGTLYLSLPFIQKYTDMESTTYTDPQRVVIRNTFPWQSATLLKDAAIRKSDQIKADIICDGTKGQTVEVVGAEADTNAGITVKDGWSHVVTEDGFDGYIETKSLSEVTKTGTDHVSAIGEYTHILESSKVNMAFYQADNASMNASLTDKLSGTTGITVLSPTWFFLNGKGDVTSIADADFVKTAHDQGIKVWALINDFGASINSKDATYAVLRGTSSREAIISGIMSEAERTGVDGLNLDLENINADGAAAYLEFLRELSVECRNKNLTLSVDTTVPMAWSSYLDRGEQGTVADYMMVMCYDEHYKGSDEAGSVASLSYLKTGIEKMQALMPSERILAGLPFYTRLWQTIDSGQPSSQIMTMAKAAAYVTDHNMSENWDETTSQNYAELNDNDGYWQIWLEDKDSITAKMKVVQESGIGGVAEWRLGDETSDVWPVINEYLQ